MATVATWTISLFLYYAFWGVLIACLSVGGMMDTVTLESNLNTTNFENSSSMDVPASTSTWSIGSVLWDIFSFYSIGADLGLSAFGNFLVTFVFVWIPSWIFAFMIIMAIRAGSA